MFSGSFFDEKIVISTPNSSFLRILKPIADDDGSRHDSSFHSLVDSCVDVVSKKDILIHKPKIIIFGKEAFQQRSVGFFSDESIGYKYSGQIAKSQPLSDPLKELLDIVNRMFGTTFNGILVNKYEDGSDTIGAHSDDERALCPINSSVISLSIGAVRKFRIRDKSTKKILVDIPTEPYSFIQMGGNFQKEFTHEIPQETRISESRISFTFRRHTE